MPIMLAYDGDDGHARLHGKVECAFLERSHVQSFLVRPCSFREDPKVNITILHCLSGIGHGLESTCIVLAIDEDGTRKGHELSKERNPLQLFLSSD